MNRLSRRVAGWVAVADDDDRNITPNAWRAEWVQAGMHWWSRGVASPKGWDATAQLATVTAKPGVRRRKNR